MHLPWLGCHGKRVGGLTIYLFIHLFNATTSNLHCMLLGVNPWRRKHITHTHTNHRETCDKMINDNALEYTDQFFINSLSRCHAMPPDHHPHIFLLLLLLILKGGVGCSCHTQHLYVLQPPAAAAGTADECGHWLLPLSPALPSSNTMGLIVHATHISTQRHTHTRTEGALLWGWVSLPPPYAPSPLECDYLHSP